jgi:hypothetical protein
MKLAIGSLVRSSARDNRRGIEELAGQRVVRPRWAGPSGFMVIMKVGFSPNGERLCFAEHVFCHFRDGRIAAVSLIDRRAIEAQLRPNRTK